MGIGPWELLIVGVIVLLLCGLPVLAVIAIILVVKHSKR